MVQQWYFFGRETTHSSAKCHMQWRQAKYSTDSVAWWRHGGGV